jgi:seryl-tRNA synthetase
MTELSQCLSAIGAASPPPNHPWANNMDLVNAAFAYQKEALELRHRHRINQLTKSQKSKRMGRMIARMKEPVIQEIERMQQEDIQLKEQIQRLEPELEQLTMQLHEAKAKSKELLQLTIKLAYYGLRGQSIPSDVMNKCHQEINGVGKWSESGKQQHITAITNGISRDHSS